MNLISLFFTGKPGKLFFKVNGVQGGVDVWCKVYILSGWQPLLFLCILYCGILLTCLMKKSVQSLVGIYGWSTGLWEAGRQAPSQPHLLTL